jgi:hypothetical protein
MLFALLGALVIAAVLVAAAMSLFLRPDDESPPPETGFVPTDDRLPDDGLAEGGRSGGPPR